MGLIWKGRCYFEAGLYFFPLAGDMEKNMEKAKDYCAYAASCGVIPLAPHTIFTQYLNDAVPEQREQGLRMGHELLERCDELWVMGDTISQGMKDEIGLATFLQLPILYVSDDMVKNQKMIRQSDRPLDINDCIPESSQYNYENQFLVLKPGVSSKGKDMTATTPSGMPVTVLDVFMEPEVRPCMQKAC